MHELPEDASANGETSEPVNEARAPFTIRPNARPGDAWRFRLLNRTAGLQSATAEAKFRAVIYKPERLGDFLLAVNAIQALIDHWGRDNTALIVSPECLALAEKWFPGLARFALPLRLGLDGWNLAQALRLRRRLAEYSCEHLVCLRHHRQPLSAAALRWIPAGHRWGVTGHPWMQPGIRAREDGLFNHETPYPWPGRPGIPVEVQAHADLVARITGAETDPRRLLPIVAPGPKGRSDDGRAVLAVVPWGSGTIKNVTADMLARVIGSLGDGLPLTVRILAEERRRLDQERLARKLRILLPGLDVVSARTADLEDLAAALAQATAVLTVDTYPAHLATAMDKPVAVLSTGALPGLFGPWSRSARQRWFCQPIDCWGCGWRCIHPAPHCLLDIPPDQVAGFLAPHLAEPARPNHAEPMKADLSEQRENRAGR